MDANGGTKRELQQPSAGAERPAKRRSRFADAPTASAPAVSAGLDDAALKAAQLAALQASIQAQIANASAALAARPAVAAPAPAPKKARDFTLRLDEQGRQIDETGKVIQSEFKPVVTLKANVDAQRRANNPYLAHKLGADKEIDARLQAKVARPKRSTFSFVKEGTFVKQAEHMREKEMMREHRQLLRGGPRPGAADVSSAPTAMAAAAAAAAKGAAAQEHAGLPPPRDAAAATPLVEWWDEPFVPEDELAAAAEAAKHAAAGGASAGSAAAAADAVAALTAHLYALARLEASRTHGYVQHPPVVRGATASDAAPAAMPMYLTKAERKRVRRQARGEKEQEKRDKMALGLIPPPPPKMKLSNFMRILGEQAVADPSKVERMVQQQVEARRMGHEMRNQARKLTPEERRAKRRAKLAADNARETRAVVLRVADLTNPKHRFKVDANAQQLGLTGCVLMVPPGGGGGAAAAAAPGAGTNAVVAEGGPRALRRFLKLMTRRIRWSGDDFDGGDVASSSEEEEEEEGGGGGGGGEGYYGHQGAGGGGGGGGGAKEPCRVVWQGVVQARAFDAFRFQECKTAELARKAMAARGVVQYWDMVALEAGGA